MRKLALTDFIITFLLLSLLYRFAVIIDSGQAHSTLELIHYACLSLGLWDDLLTGAVIFVSAFIIQKLICKYVRSEKFIRVFNFTINAILFCILIVTSIIYAINKKLLLMLAIHFTSRSAVDSLQSGLTPVHLFPFMNMTDWVLLLSPVLILFVLKLLPPIRKERALYLFIMPGIMLTMAFGMVVFAFYELPLHMAANPLVYANPVKYLARDFYRGMTNPYLRMQDRPGEKQMHEVALVDPAFAVQKNFSVAPRKQNKQWNVVMIVIESGGYDYVFDTSKNNPVPMPFLQSLSKKGLWLQNHYASGNNSPIGSFGLFSGIYSAPLPTHFMMRPDIAIPNIATLFGKQYDSFFVTSGLMQVYFPKAFITNAGFRETYDFASIPEKYRKVIVPMYMDDLATLDFFLARLQHTSKPFLAVYWPTATHNPYYQNKDFQRISSGSKNLRMHYLNNLNMVDEQIKKIHEALKQKKLLDKTIIVVVGDHGEAFSQHEGAGMLMHGTTMYQEQIKIPALIYQPELFKPRAINQPTNAVDIVPTLLDAMGIHYRADALQGESLLQRELARKYVFSYGEQDELAAVDKQNVKTQISFAAGRCVSYDLNKDPREMNPLSCQQAAVSALIKFRNYQPQMLEAYNQRLKISFSPTHHL